MADSCTEGPGNSLKLTGEPGNDLGLQQVEQAGLNPLARDASDPGITLDLGLQPSEGNRLHLGGYVEPAQASVRVAATVRRPRASVGIGKHPTLWLAVRTKAPAAAVGFVQVLRGTVAARTPRPTAAVQVGDCKPLRVSARTRRPTVSLAVERIVLSNLLNLQPVEPGNPLELVAEEGGNDLHLGGFTPIVRGEVHAAISARTRRPTAAIVVVRSPRVAIAARTPRASCWIGTGYDPNLLSDIVADAHGDWRQGAILGADARVRTVDGIRLVAGGVDQGRHGRAVDGPIAPAWSAAPGAQGAGGCGWTPSDRQAGTTPVSWRGAPGANQGSRNSYRDGTPASRGVPDEWMRGLPHLAPSPPGEGPRLNRPRGGLWPRPGAAEKRHPGATGTGSGTGNGSRSHATGTRGTRATLSPMSAAFRHPGRRRSSPWSQRATTSTSAAWTTGMTSSSASRACAASRAAGVTACSTRSRSSGLSDGAPVPSQPGQPQPGRRLLGLDLERDPARGRGPGAGPPLRARRAGDPGGHHRRAHLAPGRGGLAGGPASSPPRSIKVSGRGLSAWLGSALRADRERHAGQRPDSEPGDGGAAAPRGRLDPRMGATGPRTGCCRPGSWNWTGKAPIQAIHEAAQARRAGRGPGDGGPRC